MGGFTSETARKNIETVRARDPGASLFGSSILGLLASQTGLPLPGSQRSLATSSRQSVANTGQQAARRPANRRSSLLSR